jgi:hypothetical protein
VLMVAEHTKNKREKEFIEKVSNNPNFQISVVTLRTSLELRLMKL